MIFYQKLFKRLQSLWNMLSEKGEKQDKFVIYLLLIEVFVIILILGIKAANLAVALGTISMALAIVYIEIIKPWLQKPKIKIQFDNKRPFCLPVKAVPGDYLHYHIRLKVRNEGESIVKRVRGKLIDIKDEKDNILERFDPVFFHWSSMEILQKVAPYINEKKELKFKKYYEQSNYLDPLDLSPGEYDYLEVFLTGEELFREKEGKKEGKVEICTSRIPRGTAKYFYMNQTQDTYFLTIVISGENIEPVTEKYKLVWNGDKYDEIKMESYKENSKTIEKDKYKCAK